MPTPYDVAALMSDALQPPAGGRDIEFFTGVVQAWDRTTGENSVLVNGTLMPNLKSIQSTGLGGAWYSVGDVVIVVRKQNQFYIQGKVAAPGAGAGSGFQSNTMGISVTQDTGGVWQGLTGSTTAPAVTARTSEKGAIIIWSCQVEINLNSNNTVFAETSFEVTGASTIAAGAFSHMYARHALGMSNRPAGFTIMSSQCVTGCVAFGASSGLNPGSNTFTFRVRTTNGSATFWDPGINVIPL